MTQMNLQDLNNVIVLARKFMSVSGEQLPADQGQIAYASIGAVEKFAAHLYEQQQRQQEQQQKANAVEYSTDHDSSSQSNITTVDLNQE